MNITAIQMRLRLARRAAKTLEAGGIPRLQEVGRGKTAQDRTGLVSEREAVTKAG